MTENKKVVHCHLKLNEENNQLLLDIQRKFAENGMKLPKDEVVYLILSNLNVASFERMIPKIAKKQVMEKAKELVKTTNIRPEDLKLLLPKTEK
ncbi:TPA: hypothetical protein ACJI3N_005316 [Raoultella planticola]